MDSLEGHGRRFAELGASASDDGHVRATVVFLGDSNVGFALTAVAFALTQSDPAYVIVDVARAGTGIRSHGAFWKVRLRDVLARVKPDGFVVNLGINDTEAAGTAATRGYADYAAKIDWLMGLFPPHMPVWWTNLPCSIEPEDRSIGCRAVNDALAAAPERWPDLTVLDFATASLGRHEYLLAHIGGVHLAGPGARAWAHLVGEALNAHFPA